MKPCHGARKSWLSVAAIVAVSTLLASCGGGTVTGSVVTPPLNVSISVSPGSASLQTGATQQFSAAVTGSTNSSVTWTASAGTASASGMYTAPMQAGTYTVTAQSMADPSKTSVATVTVSSAAPAVAVSVSPVTVTILTGASQQFTATVTGSSNTAVTWTASAGTVSTAGLYTAPAAAGTYTVTARSVADTTKTASAAVTVNAPAPVVTVTISPTTATIVAGNTQQFTATVTGSANSSVTWTATAGAISNAGLYTAPAAPGSYTVTARSVADATKSASASVTVNASTGNVASTITKDGITWTFSQPVQFGQFINGDYFVIGPVTVTAINPPPTTSAPYRNGTVVNLPSSNDSSGFDDRVQAGRFSLPMRRNPPITLQAGDTLVSSISVNNIGSLRRTMRSTDPTLSPVQTVSILTVLGAVADSDAFRPSYCDRTQTIYLARNLQRNLLPSLPRPASTPALSEFEAYFRRPWLDVNQFLFDAPVEYMPDYAREVGLAVSYASLLLMVDYTPQQKELLTNYMVQYGIDLYGCLEVGYRGWPAHGGHGSGRKLPIILAGTLLNHPRMKQIGTLYPNKFGEDMQTIYVNQTLPAGTFTQAWQGATVVYGGHMGLNGESVNPGWGPYEHRPPSQWINTLGEDYRRCCTSVSWIGQALAMKLMGTTSSWNHPAFFDYADRWMTEDDTIAVAQILTQIGVDFSSGWQRQRQTRFFLQGVHPSPTFVDDMWQAYRNTVP